jgi:hypothetical protein
MSQPLRVDVRKLVVPQTEFLPKTYVDDMIAMIKERKFFWPENIEWEEDAQPTLSETPAAGRALTLETIQQGIRALEQNNRYVMEMRHAVS